MDMGTLHAIVFLIGGLAFAAFGAWTDRHGPFGKPRNHS